MRCRNRGHLLMYGDVDAPRNRTAPYVTAIETNRTPLTGVRIAVTRTGERNAALHAALEKAGATVHDVPLTRVETLDIVPLVDAARAMARYDWLLCTSAHGVTQLAQAAVAAATTGLLASRRVAVVGAGTAGAADAAGWREPVVQPAPTQAEELLDALAGRDDIDGRRVLYPCAAGVRDVLPDGLLALGAHVDAVPAYRNAADVAGQAQLRALADAGAVDVITVAAASIVDLLLDALPPERARRLPVACIGPLAARAARVAGFPVAVESPTSIPQGFVQAIVRARNASRPTR